MAEGPEVVVRPDKAALAATVGEQLSARIATAVRERGVAHVVLTGGSMGSAVVTALRDATRTTPFDPSCVHLWWGDERFLPAGDPDRNDVQNDEAGLTGLGVPAGQVHRVPGPDADVDLDGAAASYADALAEHGAGEVDVVLLGVGPDGHVASLFPHHPAQQAAGAVVPVTGSPKPPPERVSMSFAQLRSSRAVWFVVSGEDKAKAVARATGGPHDPWECPASAVTGRESTVWFVDEAARG